MPLSSIDGVLQLDERFGLADGPRAVDPTAGVIRFADPQRNIPIADLRAVAIVFTERMQRVRRGRSRHVTESVLTHSVVLVPRRARADAVELLDTLEAGGTAPRGSSIRGASMTVDEAAVHFFTIGSAVSARRQAKAVARAAHLPVVEVYGEYCVWHAAGRLDQPLGERLAGAPPPDDPGPPPPGISSARGANGLEITVSHPPRSIRLWMFLVAGAVLLSALLALVESWLAIVTLGIAVATLVYALRNRRLPAARLEVAPHQLRWLHAGRDEALEVAQLEAMRVHLSTLVLISHDDEIRCDLGSEEAAAWARRAIEHALLAPSAGA